MTLDDVIKELIEAKEHCVPGNSQVHIYKSFPFSLYNKDKLIGEVSYIDFDSSGVNLYFDEK